MTQKIVTLTVKNLDVTQLYKIRQCITDANCSRSSIDGAYMYELRELLDVMLDNAYQGVTEFKAPNLNIS